MVSQESWLESVVEITKAASEKILEIYRRSDFEVAIKSDSSPVTEADLAASKIIVPALTEFSGLPVVNEEQEVDTQERLSWKKYWLVDPLDGTKDFIARDDEFTVNIALIENHQPVLGVVAAPALNLMYLASAGKGAWRIKDQKKEQISYRKTRSSFICADSRFHSGPEIGEFCKKNGIETIERYGSSIKVCKIAEGTVDVYPRFGPTMEWDIAAAHCVANEAGCEVLDINTKQPLIYNKQSLKNPGFVAQPKGAVFKW